MRRVGPRNTGVFSIDHCTDGELGHPLDRLKVVVWHGNYSAFNGYQFTPSDYSAIRCESCGAYWRTKAAYVEEIGESSRK